MCGKKAHNAISPEPIPVVAKPPIIEKPPLPEIKKPVEEIKKPVETMIPPSDASKTSQKKERKQRKYKQQPKQTAEMLGIPNNRRSYLDSLLNEETVEYVHCNLQEAKVYKMPDEEAPKSDSFTEEIWSGAIKVINRDDFTGFLLLERYLDEIFAVCPLEDCRRVLPREIFPDATAEELQRFEDCSRFFILQVRKSDAPEGDFGEVAIGFNDRSQAMDFNIAMATVNCDAEALSRLRRGDELVVNLSKEESQFLLNDAGIDINDLHSPHSEETEVASPVEPEPEPEPEPVIEETPVVEEEPVEEDDAELDAHLNKKSKKKKYKRKGSRRSECEQDEREIDGVRYVEDNEQLRDQGNSCFMSLCY